MGDISGSRKRIVAQAGLGRHLGAFHGNRSKESGRRVPPQICENEQNEMELVSDLRFASAITFMQRHCPTFT